MHVHADAAAPPCDDLLARLLLWYALELSIVLWVWWPMELQRKLHRKKARALCLVGYE